MKYAKICTIQNFLAIRYLAPSGTVVSKVKNYQVHATLNIVFTHY